MSDCLVNEICVPSTSTCGLAKHGTPVHGLEQLVPRDAVRQAERGADPAVFTFFQRGTTGLSRVTRA